jgi:hypothetical protein
VQSFLKSVIIGITGIRGKACLYWVNKTLKGMIMMVSRSTVLILSRNANDQSRFVKVKTRLTTKGKGECKSRRDYIHVVRG